MGMILIWTAVSLTPLSVFIWWSRTPEGMKRVWIVSLFLMLGAFTLRIPLLFLQFLVTFCLSTACLALGAKASLTQVGSFLATVVIFVNLLRPGLSDWQEVQNLRREFPLESLSGRLAYEHSAPLFPCRSHRTENRRLLDLRVEQRLEHAEHKNSLPIRPRFLRELHDQTRDQFVIARGFGNSRIRHVRRHQLISRPYKSVAQPTTFENRFSYNPLNGNRDEIFDEVDENGIEPPSKEQLLWMHFSGIGDFVNSERMGYVKDQHHVAGFQSHGYTKVPAVRNGCHSDHSSWGVVRLELISLLRYPEPVAYQSENLPQMDELKSARTRSLTEFECEAIDRLRTEEDLVIQEQEYEIQMVGSLRASNECLKCHSVARGALLGALTYQMLPSPHSNRPEEVDFFDEDDTTEIEPDEISRRR